MPGSNTEKASADDRTSAAGNGEVKAQTEKKKPGNPGDFHGQRLAFLESKYGSYRLASATNPKAVREWYREHLFPEWWARFHWSLPLDREPSPTDTFADEKTLSAKQLEEKAKNMTMINNKIRTWYNNRRNTSNLTSKKSVWGPWLDQLRLVMCAPPRRAHRDQFYMKHPNFKDKVNAAFDKEWAEEPDQSAGQMMKVRCRVARKLLREETVEVQAALEDEAEEEYQVAKKKYDLGLSAESYSSAEDRDAAIETLAAVIQPLLDGIRTHTGMYVGMTAVLPSANPSQPPRCTYLSSGRSQTAQDFSAQDPAGFRLFTRLFMRWCAVAEGTLPESALQGVNGMDPGSIPSTPTSSRLATRLQLPPIPSTPSTHSHLNTELKRSLDLLAQRLREQGKSTIPPGPELLLSIARMVPAEKEKRIKTLCAMEDYEFSRENNIAKNNAALAKLGFKPTVHTDIAAEDERATPAQLPNLASPPAAVNDNPSAMAHDKSSSLPPVDVNKNTVGNNAITDNTSPSASSTSEPVNASAIITDLMDDAADVDAPIWFSSAYSKFRSVDETVYGASWFVAIRAWRDIEGFYGYAANGTALPTSSRPPQVALWIKCARYKNIYNKIPDLDPKWFAKLWWAWWLNANPSWRERTIKNRLSTSGSGSWDRIVATGINGLLNVLVTLWWWREKTPDTSSSLVAWKEAVADVAHALSAARTETLSADPDTSHPRFTKRIRTA
ncbi:hypothetical protein ONZ45_g12164 [Pleurotus djamor]|nr:hypothetical protein ONZ45_g12164 [Pleurotus djamor]